MTRFKNIYFFHDKGESPDGVVLGLETILKHGYHVHFERPVLPHADKDVAAELSLDWAFLQFSRDVVPGSLIVGVSLGGLIAARLQEIRPDLNLHVIALAAPTRQDEVYLEDKLDQRVAIYSSQDPQLAGRCDWDKFTYLNLDQPMLRYHEIKHCKYAVSYLISCYLRDMDMKAETEHLFSEPVVNV